MEQDADNGAASRSKNTGIKVQQWRDEINEVSRRHMY